MCEPNKSSSPQNALIWSCSRLLIVLNFLERTGDFTFFSEDTLRAPATKKSCRKWLVLLFSLVNRFLLPLTLFIPSFFLFSAKVITIFVWTNMPVKEKHPLTMWSRCSFNTQSLDCTWRLCHRPLFRKPLQLDLVPSVALVTSVALDQAYSCITDIHFILEHHVRHLHFHGKVKKALEREHKQMNQAWC